MKGSTEIRNLNRRFGWDLPDEETNTINSKAAKTVESKQSTIKNA